MRVVVDFRHGEAAARVEDGNVWLALGVELDSGHIVERPHGIARGSGENLINGLLVLKLYFGLCRMYVDIYVFWVDIEIDKVRHLLALRHKPLVNGLYGLVEIRVSHKPPIDEEKLLNAFLFRRLGLAHKSPYSADRRLNLDWQQVLVDSLAEYVHNALAQSSGPQVVHL